MPLISVLYIILNLCCMIVRDENGESRRLHDEELHSLYHSYNIVRVIKSRRLRWAGHVAKMEEGRSANKNFIRYTYRKQTFGEA